MSGLIAIRKRDGVDILSDGAVFDMTTGEILGMFAKQMDLGGFVMAGSGTPRTVYSVGAVAGQLGVNAFDSIVNDFDLIVARTSEALVPCGWELDASRLIFAGYSPISDQVEMCWAEIPSGQLHAAHDVLVLGPPDTPLGFDCETADGDVFDEAAGLEVMELMRRTPQRLNSGRMAHVVGGFVTHTAITKDGIASRCIHRWPDEIGQPITVRLQ